MAIEQENKIIKPEIKTILKINNTEIFLKDQESIKNFCTAMTLKDPFAANYCTMLCDMCACIVISCEKIGIGLVCKNIDFNIDMPETSNIVLPKDLQAQQEKFPSLEIQFNPDKEKNPFLQPFGYKIMLISKGRADSSIVHATVYAWKALLLGVFTMGTQQIQGLAAQYTFMQWIERTLLLASDSVYDSTVIEDLSYSVAQEYLIFILNLQQYFTLIQTILQEQNKNSKILKEKILRA